MAILFALFIAFFSTSTHAWVYIAGAPKCGEWFNNNVVQTDDLSSRASGAGNWLLLCRGKNSTHVDLVTGVTPFPLYSAVFERLDRAAGNKGENLAPGQCAWPDRGLMATEPNQLSIEVNCNPIVVTKLVSLPHPPFTPPQIGPYGVSVLATPLSFLQDENAVYGVFVRTDDPTGWTAVVNRIKGSPLFQRQLQ